MADFPIAFPDVPAGTVPYVGADGALLGLARPADYAANKDRYVIGWNSAGALVWRLLPVGTTLDPVALLADMTALTADATTLTADRTED